MKIDKKKICDQYSNVVNFCKASGIDVNILNQLKYKKTHTFHTNSKAFQVYSKLKSLGFIIEDNQNEAKGA